MFQVSKFKTRYTESWEDFYLDFAFAKWNTPVPGDQQMAIGMYCKGNSIKFSNKGIQALKNHCKRAKHLKLAATICNVKTVTSFTTSGQDITEPDSTVKVSEVPTCSKKGDWKSLPQLALIYLRWLAWLK